MKRVYTLLGALLGVSAVIGQTALPKSPEEPNKISKNAITAPTNTISNKNGNPVNPTPKAVIWSEDFSGGIGSWTNTGTGGVALWEYRGPSTTPDVTTGGRGDCSGGSPIASTTASNGFVIFDSNYLDGTNYCNPTPPNSGVSVPPHTGTLTSPSINLSANPAVNLQFEYYCREFDATQKALISVDGGTTWTEVWEAGLGSNGQSADPELANVNISTVAGGQANVQIRFEFDGDYYEWMLDDIAIVDAPSNDLALDERYYYTYQDSSSMMYYSRIPEKQALKDTITFGANISNLGATTQPNSVLTVSVDGSTVATSTPQGISDTASVDAAPNYNFSGIGSHAVTFNVSSDSTESNPGDNMITDTVNVTDTVYAWDQGVAASGNWWGNAGETYKYGRLFEIKEQDSATSVSVYVTGFNPPYSQVGKIMSLQLYNFNVATPELMGEYAFYQIQTTDQNTWVTFPLTPAGSYTDLTLAPGFYLAAFEAFNDTLLVSTGGSSAPSAPQQTAFVEVANSGSWGWTTVNGMVRLNTKPFNNPCGGSVTANGADIDCNGNTNGSVTLSGPGNTYTWSANAGGQTSSTITGLAAGTYDCTITDGGACSWTASYTVSEPAVLGATFTTTPENCGNSDGSAVAVVSGGTAGYTYAWSNGSSSFNISSVSAGDYYLTVTDANNCTSIDTATVAGDPAITSTTSSVNATCGVNDGTATVTPAGGAGSFTYLWDAAAGAQTDSTATGLGTGTYSCTVTDASSCTSVVTVNVSNLNAPTLSGTVTDVLCNGDATGAIDITATGGTGALTFDWGTATTEDLTNVGAGSYTVTVTDANNCMSIETYTVTEPTALSVNATSSDVDCNGNANGYAMLAVSGGTSSYTYMWTGGTTTDSIGGLTGGVYYYTVTDANSCTNTDSVTIDEPSAIMASGVVNGTSGGANNGAINLSASGGTGILTFSWSGPNSYTAITEDINGLAAGNYSITVTDGNGCTWDSTFSVAVGIKEMAQVINYKVYPNPNNGQFNIAFSNTAAGKYNIEVRNMIGQLIYAENLSVNGGMIKNVDLDVNSGIYFLSVSTTETKKTHRVIIN